MNSSTISMSSAADQFFMDNITWPSESSKQLISDDDYDDVDRRQLLYSCVTDRSMKYKHSSGSGYVFFFMP